MSEAPDTDELVAILTADADEEVFAATYEDVEFEAVLDSGAENHVCDDVDAPGYDVAESEGSKQGRCYLAAGGERIPNRGQMSLDLKDASGCALESVFQVAKVTRPLFSVGRICDAGFDVTFGGSEALVKKGDKVVARFQRKNGLYVSKMRLKAPTKVSKPQGFRRQGA